MLIKGYGHLLFSTVCEYFNVFICATSYEERLKCLVLTEEFPPFMDEVNHSITTMTAAGKGNDTPLFLSSVNRLKPSFTYSHSASHAPSLAFTQF